MMRAMKTFMAGTNAMPVGWRMWLAVLVLANFIMPWFFIQHVEAQVTFAAVVIGLVIALILIKIQGFTRLLGLMHIAWFPLIVYLWGRLDLLPADNLFGIWVRAVILLNGISLVIDVTDVIRYLRGERKPPV